MRLVRIDGLTPGGRALDLNPRLNVLVGAPPEVRALMSAVFAALVNGSDPPVGGQLEVHGIRMALDRESLDLLDVQAPIDPDLDLGAPAPSRPTPGTPDHVGARQEHAGPRVEVETTMSGARADEGRPEGDIGASTNSEPGAHDPARGAKEIAEHDLTDLRLELRSIGGERTVLSRRMDETRGDLDSFARATLEAAVGQLEALESRRVGAEAEQAEWTSAMGERRDALVRRLDELRSERTRLDAVDPVQVRDAADRLAAVLDPPTESDPVALDLAARLEDIVRSTEDLQDRQLAAEGLLADAERRMVDAVREAEEAQQAYRSPNADPQVVIQLERVRDEIYELEERGGRIALARSKRRIDELRAEEAELLDRLGFDTYSSYVMGIPTARSEAERAMRLDVAQSRADVLHQEVAQLRADAPGGAEDQWNATERVQIIEEAAGLVATPAEALSRLTSAELIHLLRARVLPPPPETSAEILSAAGRLASTMTAAGAPTPTAAVAPRAMLVMASDWLEQVEDRDRVLADLRRRIDETHHELAVLDAQADRSDDGGRTADLEAELLVVRERVADGEVRVARHQQAMAELADLRTLELELRDRERGVLEQISDRERLLTVLGADVPPPPRPPGGATAVPPVLGTLPEPAGSVPGAVAADDDPSADPDRAVVTAWPVDREWRLLARLGDLRSVAHVGSVPLLVSGVDVGSPDTAALLHRMHGMSELVQMVILTDDERVARWAEGLAPDAGIVHW